jgi:hypothetical protein
MLQDSASTIARAGNLMRLAALFVVLSFQSPPAALLEVYLWPGEGRPIFAAAAPRLELRGQPSRSAIVVAAWSGRVGQRLAFDDTRYRTVKAGRFLVLRAATITGRDLGEIRRLSRADYYSSRFSATRVNVKTDDTVEYLQYRGEGTCFIRVAGRVIDADLCPTQQPNSFRVDVKPETEWWIHIVDGQTKGWLLVTDAAARVVQREG